ncbi:zinc finger protein 107-like [Clytia hemisphaerica]
MHEQVSLLKNDPPKMMKPGTYECKFCHAIFDDKERLKQHYIEKHEKEHALIQPADQLFQCTFCDLKFLHYNALVQHQQTHSQRKEVYILPKQQLQGGQLMTADGKPVLLDPTVIPVDSTLLHEKVNASMNESIRMKKEQHDSVKSEDIGTPPPSTSMTTLDFQPVNEALHNKASTSSVSGERKMFRCNICDELFETEDARAKHSLVHVNRSSSLDCHICGKQFRHRTNLSTHMIVHSGIKPHQCHICLRRFHTESQPSTTHAYPRWITTVHMSNVSKIVHTESQPTTPYFITHGIQQGRCTTSTQRNPKRTMSVVMGDKKSIGGSTSAPNTPISQSADKADLQCDVCEKSFTNKLNLQKHMLSHTDSKPYQCFVCGKAFRLRLSLQKHYAVHTNHTTSFTCTTCQRSFLSKTNLQRHMLIHITATNQCYLCDRSFTETDSLERHFAEHVDETMPGVSLPQRYFEQSKPGHNYRCATCDIIFESPMIFSQHLQCHKRSLNSDSNLLDIGDPDKAYEENQACPLQCNSCDLVFMSVAKLESHMATHSMDEKESSSLESITEATVKPSNPIPLTSEEIMITETSNNGSMASTSDIGKSIKSEPVSPAASPSSYRLSRCPVCKDMFHSKEEMQRHYSSAHLKSDSALPDDGMEVDIMEEDNVFEDDDDGAIDDEQLNEVLDGNSQIPASALVSENEERLIRENEEFIKDNILGGPAEYESKGRYERGNYSCKICNRVLTYKYSLEKHMLLHTGSFPYKCQLCSKRFNHKANLDKHLVVHSGEKPYVCHICSRPFSQKSNLQRHQLTHTQNRDFVCDVCGKRFNHMASLKTHSLIHTGAKPFACYVCHKRFNQKGNLKRHIQTHRTGKRGKIRSDSLSSGEGSYRMENDRLDTMSYEPSDDETYEPIVIPMPATIKPFPNIESPTRQSERVRIKKQEVEEEYDFYDDMEEPLPTMIGGGAETPPKAPSPVPNINVTTYHELRPKDEIVTVMPSDALENNNTTEMNREPTKPLNKNDNFHCDTCSKLFVSMASLDAHKKSAHSSIVCETCGKHFSQKANLLKHKLIHLNRKPFVCKVCNKAFRQKANLQRHELIHSKDRKTVNCPECNKSFRCSWSLKQHMKNHAMNSGIPLAPGNPVATTTTLGPDNFLYGCSVCGKTFKDKDQLQIHFSVHQAPSAFGCGICNQIYPTKDELIDHMRQHDATHMVPHEGPIHVPLKT